MLVLDFELDSLYFDYGHEKEYEDLRPDSQHEGGPLWQRILSNTLAFLIKNRGFYPVFTAWTEASPRRGIAILNAHGCWENGQWLFEQTLGDSHPCRTGLTSATERDVSSFSAAAIRRIRGDYH